MSQPDFYPEGTEPRRDDTKPKVWKKILGEIQNRPGARAVNNPRRDDTYRMTREKINNALNT